jgi:hypothetical protein
MFMVQASEARSGGTTMADELGIAAMVARPRAIGWRERRSAEGEQRGERSQPSIPKGARARGMHPWRWGHKHAHGRHIQSTCRWFGHCDEYVARVKVTDVGGDFGRVPG